MRSIRIGIPSSKVKMVMFEGTEDEEAFEVKSLQRGTPYIVAYGTKYYLSNEEIQMAKKLLQLKLKWNDNFTIIYKSWYNFCISFLYYR